MPRYSSGGIANLNSFTTDNLTEGSTNQYYTNTRARAALSQGTGISYSSSTGVITNSAPYSDASARASLSQGTGISYSSSTGVITNSAPYSDASARAALSQGLGISYNSSTGAIAALEASSALGNVAGATTLNTQNGNVFTATATGAATWTFSNPASSGSVTSFVLILTNGGAGAQSWPSGTKWNNGVAPTLQASGIDVLAFFTIDGGTTWYGAPVSLAAA